VLDRSIKDVSTKHYQRYPGILLKPKIGKCNFCFIWNYCNFWFKV